jgi:hypothetical protein
MSLTLALLFFTPLALAIIGEVTLFVSERRFYGRGR